MSIWCQYISLYRTRFIQTFYIETGETNRTCRNAGVTQIYLFIRSKRMVAQQRRHRNCALVRSCARNVSIDNYLLEINFHFELRERLRRKAQSHWLGHPIYEQYILKCIWLTIEWQYHTSLFGLIWDSRSFRNVSWMAVMLRVEAVFICRRKWFPTTVQRSSLKNDGLVQRETSQLGVVQSVLNLEKVRLLDIFEWQSQLTSNIPFYWIG